MAPVAAFVVAYSVTILVGCLQAHGHGSAGFMAIVGASFANAGHQHSQGRLGDTGMCLFTCHWWLAY